ncbi:glycogen synthase [Edwardsiella ictaluri]|uniref:Glycogen synthase n=2 Tax=Edwardsiella ictaluri TaxID=67780 RepID=GLGA_EDWI9|nr:glycogen synthase GlgA [Edwardsiella ictaluri]C5B965.1 RecName: Full=Glycogen synthase; AltName: Full=Starch [bacterial glycogen] synthase [Edwardsiella ictaluri 93-146]ACR70805.1 glycogen synthase, putative [Edwardsiella ictaluri 93-146]ARD39677.1 glycogen synthase [Edwardsiella ictaluri]AVZ82402.1 glycogen synthase [Edwardsiella ictaluri]EKS7762913.1 glycogen synthase GlgA [Edwardsiella ictaluri]EKS7769825.1 glycogen synthase GlgA [Edwardsiella ictaluri]
MYVLHVCSELFPLLKTGGLADVVGAMPSAQIAQGANVRVLVPGFPAICAGLPDSDEVATLDTFAGRVTLRYGVYRGVGVYLIDAPHLYQRPGSPYHDQWQNAYGDNHLRFALLGWIAAELACNCDPFWRPQVVHAHDWHAGLACAYLAARGNPARSVFTVHNLAYQGLFNARHLDELALPHHFFQIYGLEFHGQISFMKAGLYYADHVTTVSPTYAQEITHPEFAYGMEGLLQWRAREGTLSGILNGVDDTIWNPASDALIARTYRRETLRDKAENKLHLQTAMGLEVNADKPLFAVVSRLTDQKGLDLLLAALPTLLEGGAQLALLGAGDAQLQEAFLAVAAEHPGQVGVQIGYHEAFSHRIMAGADVIVVPSRFEPCGLTQLYGLKYGSLPLVRHTGGLADTVNDCALENLADGSATGFVFHDANAADLARAIRRALVLWGRPTLWRYVQRQAMAQSFGWDLAAEHYLALYRRLL